MITLIQRQCVIVCTLVVRTGVETVANSAAVAAAAAAVILLLRLARGAAAAQSAELHLVHSACVTVL